MNDPLLLTIAGGTLLVGVGLWFWSKAGERRPQASQPQDQALSLPASLTLTPQPLLTETEADFYNLLRLSVQDQFLVFAHVPVWCLIDIRTQDRQARTAFLNQVAFKRVDFALVHPGNLAVAKVIELRGSTQPSPKQQTRDRLLDSIFHRAGIELIRLDGQAAYTAPALAAQLGLEPEE